MCSQEIPGTVAVEEGQCWVQERTVSLSSLPPRRSLGLRDFFCVGCTRHAVPTAEGEVSLDSWSCWCRGQLMIHWRVMCDGQGKVIYGVMGQMELSGPD